MKVVRLSALRTGGLYPPPPGNIPGTRFYYRLSQPQGHSAAGRVMSIKNSNDTTGNRTRDLPTCSARPQTNAPPRAPFVCVCVCVCVYIYTHTHTHKYNIHKGKAVLLQGWSGPEGSRKLRFLDFTTTAQEGGKVVLGTHSCSRLSRPQGHSAIGRILCQ